MKIVTKKHKGVRVWEIFPFSTAQDSSGDVHGHICIRSAGSGMYDVTDNTNFGRSTNFAVISWMSLAWAKASEIALCIERGKPEELDLLMPAESTEYV